VPALLCRRPEPLSDSVLPPYTHDGRSFKSCRGSTAARSFEHPGDGRTMRARIIQENEIDPALDVEIRRGLCACFSEDAAVYTRTRVWHGVSPSWSLVLEDSGDMIAPSESSIGPSRRAPSGFAWRDHKTCTCCPSTASRGIPGNG
jgi:hypothetical protein